MDREYIKITKPTLLTNLISHQRVLNDDFWKNLIFYHLLAFYKQYNVVELKQIIKKEKKKSKSDIEDAIAIYIRNYLRNNSLFDINGFKIVGGMNNDNPIKGLYDITILHSYWKKGFHFECKNLDLDPKKNLISKYVFYKMTPTKNDGGVYRYFNGKYAQSQNFGGMLGFVLDGDVNTIIQKIIEKMNSPFDITSEGDLLTTELNSIEGNDFTFNSIHKRKGDTFKLHHLLFNFQ
jgi:hypothetical protein